MLLLGAAPGLVAGAGPQITIRNQTGRDLMARAVPGQDEGVVLVQTRLEPGAVDHPGLALAEFPLRRDAEATFRFEDGSRDRQAVLLFWYATPEAGIIFQGNLILAQATAGDSPKATLTPAKSPTFRPLGQNKNLQFLSDAVVVLR
jgi:hypothetical protein